MSGDNPISPGIPSDFVCPFMGQPRRGSHFRMQHKHKLSIAEVRSLAKKPGRHRVSDGLYLQVDDRRASWLFRYMIAGKARSMGLGPLELVSLGDAREAAIKAAALIRAGQDPLGQKPAVVNKTFDECAEEFIKAKRTEWTNQKHTDQWIISLRQYVSPVLGKAPVASIGLDQVEAVLRPIWNEKTETASRVRGRIEKILDWAKVKGFRTGDNPALWRGHLDKIFPAPRKIQRINHHAALPYAEISKFMSVLRSVPGRPARALEFLILTAARSGEILGARWNEIDWRALVWTVPASRMKAGREHRVPLSTKAIELLEQVRPTREAAAGFVFPGRNPERRLYGMALLLVLRRMGRADVTPHGFRSTFCDWAAERTNFPREVVEMALAHAIGNKVEEAYRRGDLFEKRSELMDAWAEFCLGATRRPEP
jgi:integrase